MPLFVDTDFSPTFSRVRWGCKVCDQQEHVGEGYAPGAQPIAGTSPSTDLHAADKIRAAVAAAHKHCRDTGHPTEIFTGCNGLLTAVTQAQADRRPTLALNMAELQATRRKIYLLLLALGFFTGGAVASILHLAARLGA